MTNTALIQGYEVVIGFETHAQLSTHSKIFSRAATAFGAEPNTQACAVDLALPGTLPVMNKGAVERAIQFGLAVGARIAPRSIFARKNYFYPDLPKGYQISQYEIPVVQGGVVEFFLGDKKMAVRLVRAHLEEDAGKSLHEDFVGQSGIDLNRAGTPLLEIVTEPDMRSSAEAVAYARELHKIVTWIGICDGNMQEGSFRCDANVSVRKPGAKLGTRREIKNLNSFKFMQQAIDYEARWQIEQIEDGHTIQQATVLFNPDTGETRAMRNKEDASDYRYFPDPDLPPLCISDEWVATVRSEMAELPRTMAARFMADYGLSEYVAMQLTQSIAKANYFEAVLESTQEYKLASNWIIGEVFKRIKNTIENSLQKIHFGLDNIELIEKYPDVSFFKQFLFSQYEIALGIECSVLPFQLGQLINRVADGTISNTAARQVFEALWLGEKLSVDVIIENKYFIADTSHGVAAAKAKLINIIQDNTTPQKLKKPLSDAFSSIVMVDAIIEAKGLKQMNDTAALEKIIDDVIAANPKNVAEFKAGNEKALNGLVGQIMKASKGKANPQQVNDLLRTRLG